MPFRTPEKLDYYQFEIRDDLKAAQSEAARRAAEYVEQP